MTSNRQATASRADTWLAAILIAALIGAGLIWVAGFANADVLHAAAHDGRHSFAFPCH